MIIKRFNVTLNFNIDKGKFLNILDRVKICLFTNKINLTHTGEHKMVNIGQKNDTFRYARAVCYIKVKPEIIKHIKSDASIKGDILRISEIAGISAAKKTSDLIPLCHQINLNTVKIKIHLEEESCNLPLSLEMKSDGNNKIYIESYVESCSKTGVEMEAMVSVSIAALTLYDMCKSVDKSIEISEIKLIEKFGGKSGHYKI